MEYKVISAYNLDILEAEVNAKLKEGWEIWGDIVIPHPLEYYQALVKWDRFDYYWKYYLNHQIPEQELADGMFEALDEAYQEVAQLEAENKDLKIGINLAKAYIINLESGQPFPDKHGKNWKTWLRDALKAGDDDDLEP
jgi:hypothetical protein